MAGLAFLAIFAFHAQFPLIVLSAGLLGTMGGKFAPGKFAVGGGHGVAKESYGPALIDDHTPTSGHARFTWPRLAKVTVAGLVLWGAVMGGGSAPATVGTAPSRRWAGVSPKRRCSRSAGPMRCCPMSTRARSNTTIGLRRTR